ncbi:MAG: hypothetical protein Q9175_008253, partial [Cornicularia normoerica]
TRSNLRLLIAFLKMSLDNNTTGRARLSARRHSRNDLPRRARAVQDLAQSAEGSFRGDGIIPPARDAPDVVASGGSELDAAGADAAAGALDEQGLAFGGAVAALGGGHVESEGALLEEAGGGRVDAQGQDGRVGPGDVGWDFGDEGHFQDDVLLEAGVLVDVAWKRVRDADDAVARLEVLDAGADFFDEAGDVAA